MQVLFLRRDRVKPFLQRHSWVFSGAVARSDKAQSVGLAEVRSEEGQVLGYGFSDPESQIVCRIFHFGPKPETGFNRDYWKQKFEKAQQYRLRHLDPVQTDMYRLIHAEGDELPGLIADVYGGDTVVLHTLIDATSQWADTWVQILLELGYKRVLLKKDKSKAGIWKGAEGERFVLGKENGIRFWVDVEKGQKTGFFLDQRDSRQRVGQLAKGRKVLNAFAYSGGFSMYALAEGAREVVSLDISEDACQTADRNAAENGFADRHKSVAADCFDYLREMDTNFDLVVLDPPAFAKNKSAVEKASRGYKDINRVAMSRMPAGSWLATFSCSQHVDTDLFRKIVFSAAVEAGRPVRVAGHFHQPFDHPVSLFHPEGEYLKGLLLYLE